MLDLYSKCGGNVKLTFSLRFPFLRRFVLSIAFVDHLSTIGRGAVPGGNESRDNYDRTDDGADRS